MTVAKRDTYTPETLLDVAVRVFNERGYDGTSMEHLSQAAGISKSSIYHHVSGKEELLRRAVSRALDALFAILEEPGASQGRAIERVEYVTRRTVEVLMAEVSHVTLLLRVRGNTKTERWAMERRREFDQRVADLLKAAAADGDLRADVDIRLATRLLFGMVNSLVEWYRPHPGGGHEGDQLAETVVRLAFDGLRTGPGGSPEAPTEAPPEVPEVPEG
ncbi:TetR/AcrR family transcriptional regulator [Streptomyces jumonjinensis]|uniref:TetR/AcrR family transcriptional regulator n=1 Tax=Streptomyces jumonjinensis TaxID=1945 RepID=UPI0037975821